jgi:hypothetical protein
MIKMRCNNERAIPRIGVFPAWRRFQSASLYRLHYLSGAGYSRVFISCSCHGCGEGVKKLNKVLRSLWNVWLVSPLSYYRPLVRFVSLMPWEYHVTTSFLLFGTSMIHQWSFRNIEGCNHTREPSNKICLLFGSVCPYSLNSSIYRFIREPPIDRKASKWSEWFSISSKGIHEKYKVEGRFRSPELKSQPGLLPRLVRRFF